jgi:hypothetical protein
MPQDESMTARFTVPFVACMMLTTSSCARDARHAVIERPAATGAAVSADTVVRRVMRVTRRPWMIQRATGLVRARRALEPLDSIFALRVLDQRGAELAGVPVKWTQVNPSSGARMQVINDVSDSLGLSRAAFVPGLTASAQGLRAEVADVAGLDFLVRIPVGAVRVTPQRAEIWSGEVATFGVELRDSSGQVLRGGTVKWSTRDTSSVALTSADSVTGRALGRLAGIATITAAVDSARDIASIVVKPVLDARFITIEWAGAVPVPIQMELRAGQLREVISASTGHVSAKVDIPIYGSVEIRARHGDSAHHPVHIAVANARDLQGLVIALIPRAWRIDAGSYEGRMIPIDAVAAMRRAPGSAGFWRVAPLRGDGVRQHLGWRADDLPIHVAFDRGRSTEPITAADSVAFWSIAGQMQRDLGARLFAPSNLPAERRGGEVIPVEVGTSSSEGHTDVTWSERGDATDAVVSFRRAATLRDAHVVTHELLHLLGFGHTSAWRTVVALDSHAETRLTPEDVAYAQLAMRLRQLYQQSGARPGLPAQGVPR